MPRTRAAAGVGLAGLSLLLFVTACSGSTDGDAGPRQDTAPTRTASPVDAPIRARLERARVVRGEQVRVVGRVRPASRPVLLQRLLDGAWKQVATGTTEDDGAYSLAAPAPMRSARYRVVAPQAVVERVVQPARMSRMVQARRVTTAAELTLAPAPVGQDAQGRANTVPGEVQFTPPRSEAPVSVQRQVGGRWRTVVAGRQDPRGRFTFQLPDGLASARLRAVTRPSAEAVPVATRAAAPALWRQVWSDEFDGTEIDPSKWQPRLQSRMGRRLCASPSADRVVVRDGAAVLSVRRAGPKAADCPHGVWDNAMIGTGEAVPGFEGTYGMFAARVHFQKAQGMHGSFWMQGPQGAGAEIDVAEYFGDGRADGGLSSFVHYTSSDDVLSSSGGIRSKANIARIIGDGRTPADGWHVYSMEWTPDLYVFRVDGVATFRTRKPLVVQAPEYLILSLLTSDFELPRLSQPRSTMKVDWVRVWQQ